jgi:hypothetical protein
MYQHISSGAERDVHPHRWRTIRHFAYVDRPFWDVRRAVAATTQDVLAGMAGTLTVTG